MRALLFVNRTFDDCLRHLRTRYGQHFVLSISLLVGGDAGVMIRSAATLFRFLVFVFITLWPIWNHHRIYIGDDGLTATSASISPLGGEERSRGTDWYCDEQTETYRMHLIRSENICIVGVSPHQTDTFPCEKVVNIIPTNYRWPERKWDIWPKAYPSASGDPIRSGATASTVIEHKANIVGSRGHHVRFSALPGRVPEPLSG